MDNLVIIGSGPAGLSAAVSAASDGLPTIVLEQASSVGGQASTSSRIENYLGFARGLTGAALATSARKQAERFGAELRTESPVIDVRHTGDCLRISCAEGSSYDCSVALIASGVAYKRLEVPGIDALIGRGVFYGASPADARRYAGQDVYVVGGANSAGQAAYHLAQMGANVVILTRSPLEKSMSEYLVEKCLKHRRIRVEIGARVAAVHGGANINSITIADNAGVTVDPCSGLFVFIGAEPRTEWAPQLTKDPHGFLVTDSSFMSNIPGVFVAGDVRSGSVKRVASATGEGAMAISHIHAYQKEGNNA